MNVSIITASIVIGNSLKVKLKKYLPNRSTFGLLISVKWKETEIFRDSLTLTNSSTDMLNNYSVNRQGVGATKPEGGHRQWNESKC